MDTDEKLLTLLISRVTARESASLAFVTITASASLVFLGFAINKIPDNWFIPIIGILFPIIGIAYSELTRLTIHNHDHCQIRKLILDCAKNDKERKEKKKIILFCKHRWERGLLVRLIFFLPIFSWLFVVLHNSCNDDIIRCLSVIGILFSGLVIIWITDNDKPIDECCDD